MRKSDSKTVSKGEWPLDWNLIRIAIANFVLSFFSFFPVLVLLLFFGAILWAKFQDPFSRRWFSLKTAAGHSFDCVAVLPKPVRRCPVVVYAHGAGGSLMTDGNDLRQMAEMGLATVSLEYNQTNEAEFAADWLAVQDYLARQSWADTNAVAWVGCSLGANWMWDVVQNDRSRRGNEALKSLHSTNELGRAVVTRGTADDSPSPGGEGRGEGGRHLRGNEAQIPSASTLQPSNVLTIHSESPRVLFYADKGGGGCQPQVLVLISGTGLPLDARLQTPDPQWRCPTLLVHGEQDEVFSSADTVRLAGVLRTNGVAVTLRVVPGVGHDLEPERGVVFRGVGEDCLAHLVGPDWWRNYHSIAEWQAEAPAIGWFWIPAAGWAAWGWRRRRNEEWRMKNEEVSSQEPEMAARHFIIHHSSFIIRLVAVVLATWAVAETALHLVPPHLVVSEKTLALARRFLVLPKERGDFEYLAAEPIWSGVKLRVLLDHVELACYNRELINWQIDEGMYRQYVLEPELGIEVGGQGAEVGGRSDLRSPSSDLCPLHWRRVLWEEFYPRIRHESSPGEAARIVERHLRERVTIVAVPGLSHSVPEMWRRQVVDEAGFAVLYVAALRSVGVPARLARDGVEFWDGERWRAWRRMNYE